MERLEDDDGCVIASNSPRNNDLSHLILSDPSSLRGRRTLFVVAGIRIRMTVILPCGFVHHGLIIAHFRRVNNGLVANLFNSFNPHEGTPRNYLHPNSISRLDSIRLFAHSIGKSSTLIKQASNIISPKPAFHESFFLCFNSPTLR